ncbi:MAG: serine--tRNA ligase, partial [Candidatus Krumholzibacteria bacterium]|nr:serine--tRNA ligase [Candidatus Krumholzibacteria bacterium]
MLDRKLIRKDPDTVGEGIKRKGVEFDIDGFLELDDRMCSLIHEVEKLKHERNVSSEKISACKKEKKNCDDLLATMKETSNRIKEIDVEIKDIGERLDELELGIPNIPHETVPYGTCPEHNVHVKHWGESEDLPFEPETHWDIGEKLGILDMEGGSRLSGRGFVVLKGGGALLSRALISFML